MTADRAVYRAFQFGLGIFALTALLVILYWWWWVIGQARAEGFGRTDVPKLSLVLGLTILTIGAIVGVTIQLFLALGITLPTSPELIGTHASAQIGGYLVLVSAGIAEWRLSGGGSRSRAGVAQAYLLFLGGLLLAIGVGMNIQPLQGIATLFQVIGIVIVAIRFGARALRAPWGEASGTRHVAISVPVLGLGLILAIYFLGSIIQAQGDFTKISLGMVHALDHTFFVGVMTNT